MLAAAVALVACDRPAVTRSPEGPEVGERLVLEVTVIDAAGDEVDGGWVTLEPGGRDRPVQEGEAHFERLLPGTYTVHAAGPDGTTGSVFLSIDVSQQLRVRLDPREAPPALTGTVLAPDGSPAEGAEVWLDGALVATTAEDGTFTGGTPTAGLRALEVRPPALEPHWLPFTHEALALAGDGTAALQVQLAGAPPATAVAIGAGPCGACHPDQAATFADTAHARAGRTPAEAEAAGDLLVGPLLGGPVVVPLDAAGLPGATAAVTRLAPGSWTVRVTDALGATTGELPVTHVYGGHRAGAALAVERDGAWAVAPVAWAAAGAGLSSQQHPAGYIAAWTEGWFDGEDLAPDTGSSFDLQCGGCHATGHALVEPGPVLQPAASTGVLERTVGCEACHGAGSVHRRNLDVGAILDPAKLPAERRLEVCARCHERTTSDVHPFDDPPAWPVTAAGDALSPADRVSDHGTVDPDWWLQAQSSRVRGDHLAELRASPHRQGPQGWDGNCEDCHDPHGSGLVADLRATDNTLCTVCHGSRFPDEDAEAAHAAHTRFEPGPYSPGGCTGCHLPRSGLVVRRDAVTAVGEDHGHQLQAWLPADALAEFDAAGVEQLAPEDVPIGPCLDCHMNVDAERRDAGGACPCPRGDLGSRVTYDNLGGIVTDLWGVP